MSTQSVQKSRRERLRRERRRRQQRESRRGVLLLVVLSMLVLFLLVGTTFVIVSGSYRSTADISERAHRTSLQAGDRLEKALLQVLRDTNDPNSSIRYHSLLRDLYGADGFVGHVYAGTPETVNNGVSSGNFVINANDLNNIGDGFSGPPDSLTMSLDFSDYASRYAEATSQADPLGPSRGQLIDIYVQDDVGLPVSNPSLLADPDLNVGLRAEYVVDLELNEDGLTTNHQLSRVGGYYNGCLLTILEGPAKGQTTRVVQYDYITESPVNNSPVHVGRFRVLAFPRSDGTPLVLGPHPRRGTPNDLVYAVDSGNPIGTVNNNDPFFGVQFMVTGRPYNGSGVGLNPVAEIGGPRLSAVELVQAGFDVTDPTLGGLGDPTQGAMFAPVALLPNAAYHNARAVYGRAFNNAVTANDGVTAWLNYGPYPGVGGSDESYDAADFQNMYLAMQSLRPRPEARVFGLNSGLLSLHDPSIANLLNSDTEVRLQLDDVPIPSFHRPALINYWFHQLHQAPWLATAVSDPNSRMQAILSPYDETTGLPRFDMPPAVAAQITAIKRKISLRPLREDHPGFDGSNPDSVVANRAARLANVTRYVDEQTGDITFPFWEATGPWDVDNDNDGVPDSIWVDLGDPVQKLPDGRMYKPLYAILVQDMDGRLNLNNHGAMDDVASVTTDLDLSNGAGAENFNLVSGASSLLGLSGSNLLSSNQLPHGAGWGPGEISLRPVLSPELLTTNTNWLGNADYDDNVRVMIGRPVPDGTRTVTSIASESTWGRYGSGGMVGLSGAATFRSSPAPGVNVVATDAASYAATTDPLTPFDFFGYPEVVNGPPSGFMLPPDLLGRYATPGLGYGGVPNVEAVTDPDLPPLVADSPYEMQSSVDSRRGAPQAMAVTLNDDAPFTPAELERLLRPYDVDSGRLPDRLWNLVDAFDPDKLVVQLAAESGVIGDPLNAAIYSPSSAQLVQAQLEANERRRSVTTTSSEVPSTSENWTARMTYGADGRPGIGAADDDQNGVSDEAAEFNRVATGGSRQGSWTLIDADLDGVIDGGEADTAVTAFNAGNDDYLVVMGANPPANARLVDFLRYRVTLELKRKGVIPVGVLPDVDRARVAAGEYAVVGVDTNTLDQAEVYINRVIYGENTAQAGATRHLSNTPSAPLYASYGGLLAPELMAGLKMDVNRPFGDGRDNNGNGVVDEPAEAGEPWIDENGDGLWSVSEPYQDLDGDGEFDPPLDTYPGADLDGNGTIDAAEYVPFDYTAGVDANGRGAYANGTHIVRDDSPLARQLYARHLYCLMLLVMDENYLAPIDELDPQSYDYINPLSGRIETVVYKLPDSNGGTIEVQRPSGDSGAAYKIAFELLGRTEDPSRQNVNLDSPPAWYLQARQMALRKLTCRKIAQWAVNCVDMRDADAIMTPFEYDENPWDGWNVVDSRHERVYPIDGDLTTDENLTMFRTPTRLEREPAVPREPQDPPAPAFPYWREAVPEFYLGVDGASFLQAGSDRLEYAVDFQDRFIPDPAFAYDQTRGVVWGMERQELLITEGLATHDRYCQDIDGVGDFEEEDQNQDPFGRNLDDGNGERGSLGNGDEEMDQQTPPKASLFVEVFNPNSATGHAPPAELYADPGGIPRLADLDRDGVGDVVAAGVLLDRVSDAAAPLVDNRGFIRVPGQTPDPVTLSEWRADTSLADPTFAPSPVWRMAIVEEHPELRNNDPIDNEVNEKFAHFDYPNAQGGVGDAATLPWAYRDLIDGFMLEQPSDWPDAIAQGWVEAYSQAAPATLLLADPDFPTFDRDAVPTLAAPVTAGSTAPGEPIDPDDPNSRGNRGQWRKPMAYIEREFYFTRGLDPNVDGVFRETDPSDIRLYIPERPWIVALGTGVEDPFTTGFGIVNLAQTDFWRDGIAETDRPNPLPQEWGGLGATSGYLAVYPRYFPPVVQDGEVFRNVPIAPVLPGHYGIVGSAGVEYDFYASSPTLRPADEPMAGRFITMFGRTIDAAEQTAEGDSQARMREVASTRRIELIPNANPFVNQFMMAENAGDENRVMAQDGAGMYRVNVYDPTGGFEPEGVVSGRGQVLKEFNLAPDQPCFFNDGVDAAWKLPIDEAGRYPVRPIVAIPVQGMNISAPVDRYLLRRIELDGLRQRLVVDDNLGERVFKDPSGEGTPTVGFDVPLDIQPENCINHTTPNYRSAHLQRLANPMLAWNPPPLKLNGTPHPQHDPERPVNPYLTVDSMSLDLTAYNGATRGEYIIGSTGDDGLAASRQDFNFLQTLFGGTTDPEDLHRAPEYLADTEGGTDKEAADRVLMTLATQYRGAHEDIVVYDDDGALQSTLRARRQIWQQERPNRTLDIVADRLSPAFDRVKAPGNTTVNRIDSALLPDEHVLDYPIRHSLGYDNDAVVWNWLEYRDQTNNQTYFRRTDVMLRGTFTSDLQNNPDGAHEVFGIDVDGDGLLGDLVGKPVVNQANQFAGDYDDPRTNEPENSQPDYRDDTTHPWVVWNDRPMVSAAELLLVPATSSSRLTADFSLKNPFESNQPNRFEGSDQANSARLSSIQYPYGELLPAYQASTSPAIFDEMERSDVQSDLGRAAGFGVGSANFHRIMDYVHTPSRFVGTDLLMDPTLFNTAGVVNYWSGGVGQLSDPRRPFQAPFNRVAKYREPGKVNLNTIVGTRDPAEPLDSWSNAYDGLMHRVEDGNLINYTSGELIQMGHLGPAWRDVVLSRRGYSSGDFYSEASLNSFFPTRYANPFRAADAGDLVPLQQLVQVGADASLLRAHPISPGTNGVWGGDGDDAVVDKTGDGIPDRDLVDNNASEAGAGEDFATIDLRTGRLLNSGATNDTNDNIIPSFVSADPSTGVPVAMPEPEERPVEPLFASGTTEAALDAGRNPGIAYNPLTRLDNLTTTRSGVFAVWITVGFFEVTPAPSWTDANVQARFGNDLNLYNRVYHDGYQLGREIGIDTGDTKRFRGFWLIDRTVPVAFKPGEDVNSEEAILLRRRIE